MSADPKPSTATAQPAKTRKGRDWGEAVAAGAAIALVVYFALFHPEMLNGWYAFAAFVMFGGAVGALFRALRKPAPAPSDAPQDPKQG